MDVSGGELEACHASAHKKRVVGRGGERIGAGRARDVTGEAGRRQVDQLRRRQSDQLRRAMPRRPRPRPDIPPPHFLQPPNRSRRHAGRRKPPSGHAHVYALTEGRTTRTHLQQDTRRHRVGIRVKVIGLVLRLTAMVTCTRIR